MTFNKEQSTKVFVALPVLNEFDNIPHIINNLLTQQDVETELIVCVNQPDEWWSIPDKKHICEGNRQTLQYLFSLEEPGITIIDKSSPGNGWKGKKHGVGWARKTAMDVASAKANDDDIIVSVDADTWYPEDFLNDIVKSLNQYPKAAGFSAPYYHQLTGNSVTDRCILRYEIYMRNYALNMLLIKSPYAFSAIGSGMATTAKMYRKVSGLTPKLSGEDFYFIQKLRKAGPIIINGKEIIYPASRFSDRVYFGTGPAMIKGRSGNWDSYPIYPQELFSNIKVLYDSFNDLFYRNLETPVDSFLIESFLLKSNNLEELWNPLRANTTNPAQFVKAASHKIDALKILQYLKQTERNISSSNESRLAEFLSRNFDVTNDMQLILNELIESGFDGVSNTNLNLLRDFMFVNERKLQKEIELV